MQVNRPSNIAGYGQGPGAADRSNRDGQRKHGGKDEPKKQAHAEDEVELHEPEGQSPSNAKPGSPAVRTPSLKPQSEEQPPLDLSA